jgi:anti-sigma factor RsiW
MKPKTCQVVEQNLWRYIDRELSAKQVSEISSHLKVCGDCKRFFEARSREASLYRLSFVDSPFGDEFAERFSNRLLAEIEEREDRQAAAEVFTFNPPVHHRRVAVIASIAAIGLMVLLGFVFRDSTSDTSSPVADGPASNVDVGSEAVGRFLPGAERAVKVLPGARGDAARDSVNLDGVSVIVAGAHFVKENPVDPVVMEFRNQARLTLEVPDDWSFEVFPQLNEDAFYAKLYYGSLYAEIEHQGGRPFVIDTPNGQLSVKGTRFRLLADLDDFGKHRTSIDMDEGIVEFLGKGATQPVRVTRDSHNGLFVYPPPPDRTPEPPVVPPVRQEEPVKGASHKDLDHPARSPRD